MSATGRTILIFTLGAILATLVPGVCAADCAAFMECCRREPASETIVTSSTCCKAGQPDMSGPAAGPAEVRIKVASDRFSSSPFVLHASDLLGSEGAAQAALDLPTSHRAPNVPLYLLNAAVLC